jgi:hypothetical protein
MNKCKALRQNRIFYSPSLANFTKGWIGDLDIQHDYVYVEDAASACTMLGEAASSYG